MYKLFDELGNEISHHDLQDKAVWCKTGATIEEIFVEKYGEGLGIIINPAKVTDPFAPDLIILRDNRLADLKVQNTPFFKSQDLYSTDPTYAVVFNQKDRDRYNELYPEIAIFFWVVWQAVRLEMYGKTYLAEQLDGVWYTDFKDLNAYCIKRPLHYYQQRHSDTKGNARCSYVLDILDPVFTRVI